MPKPFAAVEVKVVVVGDDDEGGDDGAGDDDGDVNVMFASVN